MTIIPSGCYGVGITFHQARHSQNGGTEIGRNSIPGILVSDFMVEIPQIEFDHDYNIDFYADLNGNGLYDAPPVDHAWRVSFTSTSGDHVENFEHNTNFTDIQWPVATSIDGDEINQPSDYALYQNYPNPFNPETNIRFNLINPGFVSLKVYDILGREVVTLIEENMEAGLHELTFDASSINSGIYLYRIETDNFVESKRMILIK